MIDVAWLREHADEAKTLLAKKQFPPEKVEEFLALDKHWRGMQVGVDSSRQEINKLSKELSKDRNTEKEGLARKIKQDLKKGEEELRAAEEQRTKLLEEFPNPPFPDVPEGISEKDNKIIREEGEKPQFTGIKPKDYLTLGKELDLIDVERSGKVSGTRFGYLKNEAVLLEFALIHLAYMMLVKDEFTPIVPPVMIRPEMLRAMGKIKFIKEKDAFHLAEDDLYLAGSSEHTIGPMHAGEVLENLPMRYAGFSTCFRREAGSYGKDTKGILRVHQFDKVEMFSFTKPEDSEEEHKKLLGYQEAFMKALNLPYRVVEMCTGDMGFTDARQYDIEVWIPSENAYRETHSCSNTTDFQARGINTKYRNDSGKLEFVHTLNGTAFAIGRMLIAILENNQTKKGTVMIPDVLSTYTGFKEIRAK